MTPGKDYTLIHRLTIITLLVVMAMSLKRNVTVFQANGITPLFRIILFAVGVMFWIFLICKIWEEPRRYDFGIGVFLTFMLAFQIFLYTAARRGPKPDLSPSTFIFGLHETPLLAGIVCCILLKMAHAGNPRGGSGEQPGG